MLTGRQLSRVAPRATRIHRRQQLRLQSTSPPSTASSSYSHIVAGAVGGVAGAALLHSIYSFTPAGRTANKLNQAAAEVNKKYQIAADKLQKNTPSPEQAVESIKQFAYSYVSFIPGGRNYVDAAFKDLDSVRKNHKDETDKIISDAYKKFQEVSKSGLSFEAASKGYDILADVSKKIAGLAGDAMSDIIDNHPQVKERLGGSIKDLQSMGEQYGPEAKKQVEETWGKLKNIFSGGLSDSSFEMAHQLIEEKVQRVRKLGHEAWNKGLEEAKPYLDKNPKAKELIEKNADVLIRGNFKEFFAKLRSAVESNDMGDLEKYVNNAMEKVRSTSAYTARAANVDEYLKKLPQGDEILLKLQQIEQVAEKHQEGKRLLEETIEDLTKILEKQSQKAQDIVRETKEKAK